MIRPWRCQTQDMKRVFPLVMALSLLAFGAVHAQDAEEQEAAEDSATEAEASEPAEETVDRASADEVFVPSERISADQEVIFPVDI